MYSGWHVDGVTGVLLPCSGLVLGNPVQLEVLTCFMFLFGSPASSSANLIASEIFPTSTRSIVLSVIFLIDMVGSLCGVWSDNYFVSGGLMILGGVMGFWLCPSTERKSL
jgi:hypothetical protein